MWIAIIIMILLAIALLLVIGRHISGQPNDADRVDLANVDLLTSIEGYDPAIVYRGQPRRYGVSIDPSSNQFAVTIEGMQPRLYHFSQLISAEVEKDGETITTTEGKVDAGGAAIATALIGPLGLAVGAKTRNTSTTQTTVSKLSLKLYVNDLHTPCYEIPFLNWGIGQPAANPIVKEAAGELDAWYGRFQAILVGMERNGVPGGAVIEHAGPATLPEQEGWGRRVFGA